MTAGIGQELRGVGNGRRTKEPSKELSVMAIPVVEFSREGYKIKRFLTEIWRIGLVASCQKVPKFDFQSQFTMSKII